MASPTPVLPEVGSTIVPPGWSSPEASAASIIRSAIRSFTEPPGLRYSTLASTSGPPASPSAAGVERRRQPQQRGVADQVEERVHVLHLFRLGGHGELRPAPNQRCVTWRRGDSGSGTQAGVRRGVRRRWPVRARRRALRRAPGRGQARPPDDRRDDGRRRPTRPAGTAAAAPARRSRSRCWATPAPPGTASSGSRRPPARSSPAGWPSRPTAGSTCGRTPWSAPGPRTSPARSTAPCRPSPTSP